MTTYADGVFQWGGVPVAAPGPISVFGGNALFVNGYAGTAAAGNNGLAPESAFTTMDQALDVVRSGQTIYVIGNIREQLVAPVGVFDVRIVGCGTRPRHADAHTNNNGYATATWRAPSSGAVSGQATLRLLQQGWLVQNILFTSEGATAACVEVVRNAASGDSERDGSHASILGCRFSGTGIGVKGGATSYTENTFNVLVEGNTFNNMTLGLGTSVGNGWQIRNNTFFGNTAHITAILQNSFIVGNQIGPFTASGSSGGIDLNGGTAGNVVTGNLLSGTYSIAGGYRSAGAADEWGGNYNSLTGGVTAARPA